MVDTINTSTLNSYLGNRTHYKFNESVIAMKLTAFATCVLFVCGTFSNLICIDVLNTSAFKGMSGRIHMKTICWINSGILLLQTIQNNALVMDASPNVNPEQRRYICTLILWFVLLFDTVMPCSISLAIWNRIKAQRELDDHVRKVDAFRGPFVSNTVAFLLCSVMVSLYIDDIQAHSLTNNHTECTYLYFHTFPEDLSPGVFGIWLLNNCLVIETALILILLLILGIEVTNKIRRKTRKVRASEDDSITLLTTMNQSGLRNIGLTNTMSRIGVAKKSTQERNMDRFSAETQQRSPVSVSSSMVSSDNPSTVSTVLMRDYSFTLMIIVIATLYILAATPRGIIQSSLFKDTFPSFRRSHESISLRFTLDIMYYIYLAATFPLLWASNKVFRTEAYSTLFQVTDTDAQSDISLAPTSVKHSSLTLTSADLFEYMLKPAKDPVERESFEQANAIIVEDFDMTPAALRAESGIELPAVQDNEKESSSDTTTNEGSLKVSRKHFKTFPSK